MTTKTASIYDWVDERLGLSELAAFARHKTVPVHAQSFWYYWGGISLFLFLVQCFTGVLSAGVLTGPAPNPTSRSARSRL